MQSVDDKSSIHLWKRLEYSTSSQLGNQLYFSINIAELFKHFNFLKEKNENFLNFVKNISLAYDKL